MTNRAREPAPATAGDWVSGLINFAVELVPGARFLQRGLEAIERGLLRELKHRLEGLEAATPESSAMEPTESLSADSRPGVPETPAAVLSALLDRSIDQTPEEARRCAFLAILRQLVPDEARILSALSDGDGHPVVHVTAGSTLGASTRRILSNVSSVGQAAGVQLREMTPHYISHLCELELAEIAPEDPALAVKYEILESNTQVREAIAQIERRAKGRIVRRTLRLTPLGRDLWSVCQSH